MNELNIQFNRQRQAAITSELLDVVTGFEAITGKNPI
jgi:F0F1-type ATP synthase gamma subunit